MSPFSCLSQARLGSGSVLPHLSTLRSDHAVLHRYAAVGAEHFAGLYPGPDGADNL